MHVLKGSGPVSKTEDMHQPRASVETFNWFCIIIRKREFWSEEITKEHKNREREREIIQ